MKRLLYMLGIMAAASLSQVQALAERSIHPESRESYARDLERFKATEKHRDMARDYKRYEAQLRQQQEELEALKKKGMSEKELKSKKRNIELSEKTVKNVRNAYFERENNKRRLDEKYDFEDLLVDEKYDFEDLLATKGKSDAAKKVLGLGEQKVSLGRQVKTYLKSIWHSLFGSHESKAAVSKELAQMHAEKGNFDQALEAMRDMQEHTRKALERDIKNVFGVSVKLKAFAKHTQLTQDMFEQVYARMHGDAGRKGTYSGKLNSQMQKAGDLLHNFAQDIIKISEDANLANQAGAKEVRDNLLDVLDVIAKTYDIESYDKFLEESLSGQGPKDFSTLLADRTKSGRETPVSDNDTNMSQDNSAVNRTGGIVVPELSEEEKAKLVPVKRKPVPPIPTEAKTRDMQEQASEVSQNSRIKDKRKRQQENIEKSRARALEYMSSDSKSEPVAQGLPVAPSLPDPKVMQEQASAVEKRVSMPGGDEKNDLMAAIRKAGGAKSLQGDKKESVKRPKREQEKVAQKSENKPFDVAQAMQGPLARRRKALGFEESESESDSSSDSEWEA